MDSRTIQVQGAAVHVSVTGAGTPTLLLHGNPDSGEMWHPVMERLSAGYHCFAPDLPGYGLSAPVANFDTSLDNQARWVDGVVAALDLTGPLNLVVHDFGGHFGLAWAVRHADRVRRLAIFNTSFFSNYTWHQLAQVLRRPLLGELVLALFNENLYVRQMQRDAPHVPRAYIHRAAELYGASARRMSLRLYRGSDSRKFVGWEDELRALTQRVPSLVLWGDRDPFAPATTAERFGAGQVRHFAEYSHWLPIEAPDPVAQALDQFLR